MRSSEATSRFAGVLLAVLAAGCAGRTSEPLTPAPDGVARQRQVRDLQQDLASILTPSLSQRGLSAAFVQSIERGDVLFSQQADRLFLPASALKLVTVAVAADRLGWDYRFRTTIHRTGPVENGTLRGDLVVTGSGDPTFSARYGGVDDVFADWAARLVAAGIRRVDGRLVGDDRAFGDDPWGSGWSWDDLQHGYAAPVGALQVHDGRQSLLVVPGIEPGEPASLTLLGPPALSAVNRVVTAEREVPASISFRREPGRTELLVEGHVPAGAPPLMLSPSVPNATMHFVTALEAAFARAGVRVSGGVVDIDDLPAPPIALNPALVRHDSPPLSKIAAVTLKNSHNQHAESLFRALAFGESSTATAAVGRRLVQETLESWGVPAGTVLTVDGSGFSRYNYATAEALVAVLRHMATDERHRERWMAALAVGGVDGTLVSRFTASRARGRVRGKTGSLSHVRTLAGYVQTDSGELLAFAILLTHPGTSAADLENTIDRAVDRLALFKR